jgi:hypothetical protein
MPSLQGHWLDKFRQEATEKHPGCLEPAFSVALRSFPFLTVLG